MGISWWGPGGTYCGEATVAEPPEGVDEDVLRRHFQHLLALGTVVTSGAPVQGIGELATALPAPGLPVDLPSRIGLADVAAIRGYTDHLRMLARTYGGQARAAVALTEWVDQWLTVDGSARRATRGTQ